MEDKRFEALLNDAPATLEEFKELYKTTVYDLKHAVRHRDDNAIEEVIVALDGWLKRILENIPISESRLTEKGK